MRTRNSSARNQKTGFHDDNEVWAGFVILSLLGTLDSKYNRIFPGNCQRLFGRGPWQFDFQTLSP